MQIFENRVLEIPEQETELPLNISAVEKKYDAKYVGDFCLKTKGGGWGESPAAIFYQPNPKTELGHTHYFGLFFGIDGQLLITKGDSAFSEPIVGIVADDGEVVFSRYRHDYSTSVDGSVMMDGGRDYTRCSIPTEKNPLVHIVIDGPNLKVVPIPKEENKNGTD